MNPFSQFVNETEMVSLSGFLRAIGWLTVTWLFAYVASRLMLTGEEKAMSWGFQLAIAVLSGLGYATTVGAYNTRTVRKTSREHMEGEAKIEEAKGKAKKVNVENVESVTVQSDEGV